MISAATAAKMTEDEPLELSIDEALEMIPVGKYHYRLLVICGMSFMSDAMVRISIEYVV